MSKTETIFGFIGGGILLLIFVWIVVALHMAYTKIDILFEHLKNSPAITALAFWRRGGPWWRLRMISSIAHYVSAPREGIENGSISAEDIESLPKPIKCKLVILWRSVILLSGALFLVWCIGKIIGTI
ncbi:hypothetical protein [Pseudomonas sp. PB101]|jgi:hypothetical protein|uniref:hypothetical protein n=1 Tax=Pseudomonas sp. PB101 TaxID=2495428 RepID=UPI0013651D05|nr:hypothetical protein [Pseudomonas sp. PB101]MVW89942.1 hypothetical protein [Pseudomonas sp. PB101]